MDFSKVPPRERSVAEGASLFEKRFIGMPLVAEDTMGAIMIWRGNNEPEFEEFDREMMMVFCEQAVTAIKNLQLSEQQQKVILGSMRFIGKMMERDNFADNGEAPVYCKIMKIVAHKMGLKQEAVESLEYAGLLHETGAIDVPFEILSKTSQLTAEEFKIIREHPARCVALIKPVEFLRPVLPIILYRHEKYDGRGYPSGLKGEQIPVGARVMAVVDAFEAMISHRSYRLPMTIDEALLELKRNSGTQFDPGIIEVFGELSKQKKFRKYLSLIKR